MKLGLNMIHVNYSWICTNRIPVNHSWICTSRIQACTFWFLHSIVNQKEWTQMSSYFWAMTVKALDKILMMQTMQTLFLSEILLSRDEQTNKTKIGIFSCVCMISVETKVLTWPFFFLILKNNISLAPKDTFSSQENNSILQWFVLW